MVQIKQIRKADEENLDEEIIHMSEYVGRKSERETTEAASTSKHCVPKCKEDNLKNKLKDSIGDDIKNVIRHTSAKRCVPEKMEKNSKSFIGNNIRGIGHSVTNK